MTQPRPTLIPLAHLVASDPERKYRLMEVVRTRLRERRYSPRTEQAYVFWIRRFVQFHGRRHPRELGEPEVRGFLSHLAIRDHVAASTQNQALAALTFLYDAVLRRPLARVDGIAPARRARRVPVVLSQREVRALLGRLRDPARLCATLMYGSGLRVSECVSLRVKDVDLERGEIVVRAGKGRKDRRTPLADRCAASLRRWLADRERLHRADRRYRVCVTALGEALERKYPGAAGEWRWSYVFPASRTFVDPAGMRRRHHLHEMVRAPRALLLKSFAAELLALGGAKRFRPVELSESRPR
jgi:integron integrase